MRSLIDRALVTVRNGVMPKPLRRPMRFGQRLLSGEATIPNAATPLVIGGFLSCWVVAGLVSGGHVAFVTNAVARTVGFQVVEVSVSGNRFTDDAEIARAVGLDGSPALIGFDADAARKAVTDLPWVERAEVRKSYPSRLVVEVVEHKAAALWQVGSFVQIIDRSGQIIAPYEGVVLSGLPLVVGFGAAENARTITDLVAAYPTVADRVRAFIRVGNRRWDLQLDNGVTVKLPEKKPAEALAKLEEGGLFSELMARNVTGIDLRIEGTLVVATSSDVADARKEAFEEIEKNIRKSLSEGRT